MADDASALLDSIDPSKGATSFEGAAAPRAPQASPQDQADQMLDSIDPRVSGWGPPKGTEQPNGSSAVGAFSRAAERSALPTAGGLAGAAGGASAGAEIGALGGPVGAIAGGLIGGIGGSMLGAGAVDAAQSWALSKLPTGAQKFLGGTEDQQREDFEGHPFASILGGVAPYLLTANPGIAARETAEGATGLAKIMGNKYTAAALSGLTMGGITLGQEVVQGEKPNWTDIGINTLLGTVWSKPNALGERIMGGAEAAGARIGQRITGRAPTPETVTLADGGDQKVGPGPGLTEDVATGQAEMAPPAEAQARAAARDEQTLTEPPKAANPVELARATHSEAFEDYEALEHRRETFRTMIDDADEMGDLDASRSAQEHLAKTEEQMDGIAPEIRDAIARVAESRGSEAVEPQGDTEPVAELATPEMKQFISDDVSRQLHAAGRSEEEARAAGDLIAARYATRASVMNGAIGTAEDLYRREGAVIRGGDGTARRVVPAAEAPEEIKPATIPISGGNYANPMQEPTETVVPQEPSQPPVEPARVRRARYKAGIEPPAPPAPEAAAEPQTPVEDSVERHPEPAPAAPEGEATAAPVKPQSEAVPALEAHERFIQAVKDRLAGDEPPFRTIVEARKLAKEHGLEIPEGAPANKTVDELIERAVVGRAREIVGEGAAPAETYQRMVDLYDKQPNLSTRTSTSVAEQAYSTPAPLAYVASRLAGIDHETRVLEPTAGNGMLLMEADPRRARVNELNPDREASLTAQGFKPTRADAADPETFIHQAGEMDVVIANPPFGTVREGGQSKVFHVDDLNTTQIDHAIALNALKAMKSDGKAVLILGGVKAETEAERASGYSAKSKRRFFHELLKNYNVSDIFTVSGDLYAKQGAAWPVDVVVIDGKGKSDRDPLTKTPPPLLKTWDEVGAKLNGLNAAEPAEAGLVAPDRGQGGEAVEGGAEPAPANALGGPAPIGGEPIGGEPAAVQPSDLGGASDSPEPGPDRPEPAASSGAGLSPGEGGDVRGTDQPAYSKRERTVDEATEGQSPYQPASQAGASLNTLVPANLRDATFQSLDRLERQHGPIDSYVADSLGRDVGDLGKYFSAEQIDAIGLGISNVEKGEGFIIGDQTGIGKGRVVAAMISYAKRKGLVPLFVTEKPDLYGDMWRDLHDIGWHEQLGRPISMVMTNAGVRVPLDDEALDWIAERDDAKEAGLKVPPQRGTFSKAQSSDAATKNMQAIVRGEASPDVVFTTYDQMNAVKGAETPRRGFLKAVAPKSFLIMDEAHNAGWTKPSERAGEDATPPRSEVFRDAIGQAKSVMYSSATYAKSPTVMSLYSKTDMAKAVEKPSQLPDLIEKGGVPLQQVVASMLAKAGQYVRRERSFEGVSYDHENVPVSEEAYGGFSDGLRAVFQFDKTFEKERKDLATKASAEMGGGTAHDTGVGETAATSTSFSSIMHNVISQMIMALKAQKAGERAVESLKAGEKPVIALSKTNASFINDFLENAGIKVGDAANVTFADILKRYLERTRRVTLKSGGDEKIHHTIPLDQMSGSARAAYGHAESLLSKMDVGDLPVSPIDTMRNVLQKAGYSVREVTGRDTMLDYSQHEPVVVNRPSSEVGPSGKKLSVKKFNDGSLDSVILNKSGSTGISLHSSSKFKDQTRRRMIIAEADPNIDTHMQMLGRVHRTGQVTPPAYTHLSADIPAEVRPTAVLMRKMASLNANTTGATKSRFTSEATDFLNKYGDKVVAQLMDEDPETYYKLGEPNYNEETSEGAAAKVTGRLTLLQPKEQQALLDKITDSYKALIDQLDASGENDLEAKYADLKARVMATQTLKAATGPSPFQGAVNLDKVSIKSQGRAMAPAEVADAVANALGSKETDLQKLRREGMDKQKDVIERARQASSAYTQDALKALKEPEAIQKAKDKANENWKRFRDVASITHPGAVVDLNLNGEITPAVVMSFKQKEGNKGNPAALSTWNVVFALPSGQRSLGLPLSRIVAEGAETPETKGFAVVGTNHDISQVDLAARFEAAKKEGREDRYMVSGNILSGFDQTRGRGQIINHSMEDGTIRPAILMNRQFDAADFMAQRAVRFQNGEHVVKFLNAVPDGEIKSSDGIITARKVNGGFEFEMPAAKAKGGQYYTDRTVRDVFDGWEKKGSVMRGTVSDAKASALIDALQKADAVFETRDNQDLAASLGEKEKELAQATQGKINFKPNQPRATITMMKTADASTFIHETGHDFLEQMKRDSSHPAAPQALKDDIAAVRQWVGNKGGEFKTREHEKFARGFEQYMREGTAPTAGLARVFQQFKSWLTQIYRSIKGLGDPISPEIRRVFDRMLNEPERPAIVAPGRQPGTSLADVHESDALSTPDAHAAAARDRVLAEAERSKSELPPEIQAEHERIQQEADAEQARAAGIEPAAETGDGAAGGGEVPNAGGEAGNEPGGSSGGPQSEPKLSSGGGSGTESAGSAGSKPAGTGVGDSLLPRPIARFPEPESGLVDKAGNVRLDNLVLPEQLGEVLMESADRNADFKSVRGSMTKGEMMDLASDLGMTPEEEGLEANLAKITGKFDNLAKYALALRLLVRQSSQAVYEAATISAREGTDEATASLAKAIARHDMIQSTLSGATANWGRSGSAFHNLNSFKGATDLDKVLRDNVGRTLFQVKLIGRMIAGADATPAQVSAIVRDSGKYSFGEMILEYWVNGLISGIPTHVTYSVGNSLIAANKIFFETPTAAALSALRGREGSNVIPFGEAAAQLRGAVKGVVPAIHAATEALRTGITTALPGEKTVPTYGPIQAAGLPGAMGARLQENAGLTDVLQSFYGLGRGLKDAFIASGAIDKAKTPAIGLEYSLRGVIPNVVLGGRARLPVGDAARLPGRFISAIHSFFRAMGYSAEINGQEYRQAYNEGARGDALPQRIADLRLDRQAAVMQGATEGEAFDRMAVARFQANEQTLMGPAGKFTQMLSRFTNTAVKLPLLGETRILKFVDPFVNISGQIMNQALLKRTPLGFLAPTIRADLMGANGPVAADRALARMLVGSSLAVTAGVLAAEGYLSGAGPQDPKLMATWRLAGNQPHSVKLNDTWIDLHRIGPLGMLLGMAADLYDVAHTASHGDMQTAAGQLMHAIAQSVLDESFMRGPAELLKAIDDKSYAENQYIPNFVSSFVPYSVGMGYQARAMDPYMRLTHGTLDAIKAKIPLLSQELQPRRDLWGQPIPNREALGASGLTAIWEQKQSTDPVNLEMQRLGIGKPLPGRSLSNIKLSDQQYDDYSRISGVMTKQRMDQYVRSGMYQHQTDGDRREGIDAIFKGCREAARGMMFMKYPSIPAQATALRMSRRQGADIRAIGE